MRYHCLVSIDKLEYKGLEFAAPDTPFSLYERKLKGQEQKALNDFVMNHLTETQRGRIQLLADGLTTREIAALECVAQLVIVKSIKAARKKALELRKEFEKNLKNRVSKSMQNLLIVKGIRNTAFRIGGKL